MWHCVCVCLQLQLQTLIDSAKHLRKDISLQMCWSVMGNRSHEVCGPKGKLCGGRCDGCVRQLFDSMVHIFSIQPCTHSSISTIEYFGSGKIRSQWQQRSDCHLAPSIRRVHTCGILLPGANLHGLDKGTAPDWSHFSGCATSECITCTSKYFPAHA